VIEDGFDEETSSAWEVGFKADLSRRLYFEGALFRTDVDDMQFFEFLVGPFGLLRVVSNIDEVEIQGAELGFHASLTPGLRLFAGASITDSEILENSSRPATVGNESPYTPDLTADLGLEYSRPLGRRWVFNGSAYLTVVGETWFHTVQDETRVTLFDLAFPGLGTADYSRTRRDRHELLDLRLGVAEERWSLTLFASNVTDEDHLEEVITAPEFGGSFIHPGSRRRVGAEVAYRF
jgi:iron complex outermembrane receptor protein